MRFMMTSLHENSFRNGPLFTVYVDENDTDQDIHFYLLFQMWNLYKNN